MNNRLIMFVKSNLGWLFALAALMLGSNAALADYYIIGAESLGLNNSTGVIMTGGTKTVAATESGTGWIGIYDQASTSDASHCYYISGQPGQRVSISFDTDYTLIYGAWCQSQFAIESGTSYTISITDGKLKVVSGNTTWTLRGAFNNWSSTANVFTSGSTMSTTVSLPAATTYNTGVDNEGFKVVKNANSTLTWYGNKAIMTSSDHTDWVLSSTDATYNSNIGITTTYAGDYIFTMTVNGSGNPVLTVTYPTAPPTVPTVRWGAWPTETADRDVNTSAYIAAQGCDGTAQQDISKIRVRFWKESDPDNMDIIEQSGTYTINNAYQIQIPYTNEILMGCTDPDDNIVMEVAGESAVGWSVYSDQITYPYTVTKEFVVHNLTFTGDDSFTACDGDHQFTYSSMVLPVPDSYTVINKSTSADASADFTLTDGIFVWNPTGKSAGMYEYTFTFTKDDFESKTADVTINYNASAPSSDITSITPSVSETYPWMPVTLTANLPDESDITSVVWSSNKSCEIEVLTNGPDTFTAQFKGTTSLIDKVYTITAKGESATCTTTTGATVDITVHPDEDYCED